MMQRASKTSSRLNKKGLSPFTRECYNNILAAILTLVFSFVGTDEKLQPRRSLRTRNTAVPSTKGKMMKRMTKTSSHPNRKGLSRFTREFQNKTI